MSKMKLTKEQRKEVSAQKRAARMREAKKNLGSTIAQKLGVGGGALAIAKMPSGYEVGKMEIKVPVVTGVLGYGLAVAAGGKLGAIGEGIGDASLAIGLDRHFHKGAKKPERTAADTEEPTSADGWSRSNRLPSVAGNDAIAAAERRGFMAGKAQGISEGVKAGVAGTLDLVEEAEDQGLLA